MRVGTLQSQLFMGGLFGLVITSLFIMWGELGFQAWGEIFSSIGIPYGILIIGTSFIGFLGRVVKWWINLRALGEKTAWLPCFISCLASLAFLVTPGKAGEVSKALFLQKLTGIDAYRTAPSVLAERLADFLTLTLFCLIGFYWFVFDMRIIFAGILLCLLVLILVNTPRLRAVAMQISLRIPFLKRRTEKLQMACRNVRQLFSVKLLGVSVCVSSFFWLIQCWAVWLTLDRFHLPISFLQISTILSVGTLAGALSMLPGGVGAAELTTVGLLINAGLDVKSANLTMVFARIETLWLGVLAGVVTLACMPKLLRTVGGNTHD